MYKKADQLEIGDLVETLSGAFARVTNVRDLDFIPGVKLVDIEIKMGNQVYTDVIMVYPLGSVRIIDCN